MNEKAGIVRYVRTVKKLFIAFSAVSIPLFFVSLTFAVAGYTAFFLIAPALGILYFALYAVYALRVSMGTVIGVELTEDTIRLKTPRKTFSYDARSGCIGVKKKGKKFIATFCTANSKDSFIFYNRVLFSPYGEEQFTIKEMTVIYPRLEESSGANA